ncbi:hypothetical protein QR685DRAFT_536812 [Neurospora intermedia]|uniref:Uncharacterized protein n=1 Tax=Neurospora intermedia TaxID=5142 RepID=A0ABR3D045_NEUIN
MREFAGRILPEMEAVGWIVPGISSWGAYTKFLLKSNGDLRVVMGYRPINGVTVKLQWPMHIQSGFISLHRDWRTPNLFPSRRSTRSLGRVPMARGHKDNLKTAFIAPNDQYWNLRMPQGMTRSISLWLVREALLPTACLI